MRKTWAVLGALVVCATAACSDDDGDAAGGGKDGSSDGGGTRTLSLSLEGLEPLGDAAVYEGWLVIDGTPVTTGRFNLAADTETYTFEVPAAEADAASMFVLSIEPAEGDDPAPADAKVLAGPIRDGAATLSIDAMPALGTDFSTIAGGFILETPTTTDPDDFANGIWYLDKNDGEPLATLTLPELPAGWTYEGWVVGDDGAPISTGTFAAGDMADSDGAGDTAGPEMAPPFPGQDFIEPPRSLVGMTAVVSVEPVPDDSPAPFALKPLVGAIGATAAGDVQPMTAMTSSLPSGTVTLE